MHRRFAIVILAFSAIVVGSIALAKEDEVVTKGKGGSVKSVITSESPKGVVLKNGQTIKAEDIEDVYYDLPQSPVLAQLAYRNGQTSEKNYNAAIDLKKRAAALADTLDKYEKAINQIVEPRVKAHIGFKVGYLRGIKAAEEGGDPKIAITYLGDFVRTNPNSWEVTRALILLAKLQNDSKDFKGAAESFGQLLKLDVADDVKNDARLQGANADIQLGKYAAAESKLTELLKTLPKTSKTYPRVLVAQSECMIAGGKTKDAVELLKSAIKESEDKSLRAVAYNTLGESYFKADQLKEARWEFLWVDVVYNQDRNEHAKALYYLSKIFDRLADTDKAAQCRATLLDSAYAGTTYQQRLMKENPK